MSSDPANQIFDLLQRARRAQKIAEGFTQAKVDELAAAVTWEIAANDELVRELAEYSFDECRLGDVPSKIAKVAVKCRGVFFDVKHEKTVGIIEE
ncbi:MAG: aldehyde dehydrogenase, partial [Alkalispirochaeta sp.]